VIHLDSDLTYPVVSVEGDDDESVVDAIENALCALDGESFVVVSLRGCNDETTQSVESHLRDRTAKPNVVLATGYCRALADERNAG
jgi:hypothetical protein